VAERSPSNRRWSRKKLNTTCGSAILPHSREIEVAGLNPFAQAVSLIILAEYERTADCPEALGALNRWPGRSGVPVEEQASGKRVVQNCKRRLSCRRACERICGLANPGAQSTDSN
jgi:hypothetical protein